MNYVHSDRVSLLFYSILVYIDFLALFYAQKPIRLAPLLTFKAP